mgnify:CR=1 FL=1
MLTAVVTSSGSTFEVTLLGATFVPAEEGGEATGPENDLNPIAPELKEVVWGFGAFVVLALALRLFLFRKVRDGMTSRYDSIEADFDKADALTASARAEADSAPEPLGARTILSRLSVDSSAASAARSSG